jgi:hypothetical protein
MFDNENYDLDPEEVKAVEAEAPIKEEEDPKPKSKPKPSPVSHAVTAPTGLPPETVVDMSALVYQSVARNSASVRAIQTRLLELGHLGAGSDLPGWLSAGTLEALGEFHAGAKLKGDVLSRETIEALLKGLPVKIVG